MDISIRYKFEYVCCLPIALKKKIMQRVSKNIKNLALSDQEKKEAIESANCSKVCDLEDTINFRYVA